MITVAAVALLALVAGLFSFDWLTLRGKNRRALLLEGAVFAVAAYFIAFPDHSTALAHAVGIGRGVDFLLYPAVLWLIRESFALRRKRLEDAERLTELTRALALREARVLEPRVTAPER